MILQSINSSLNAEVAEPADAYDSKSYLRKEVRVRLPPSALQDGFIVRSSAALYRPEVCSLRPEKKVDNLRVKNWCSGIYCWENI